MDLDRMEAKGANTVSFYTIGSARSLDGATKVTEEDIISLKNIFWAAKEIKGSGEFRTIEVRVLPVPKSVLKEDKIYAEAFDA